MPSVRNSLSRLACVAAVSLSVPVGAQEIPHGRALQLEQQEKYSEAAAAYREALVKAPGSISALLGLERVYAQLGWTDSLLPVLARAVTANPRESAPRAALIRTLRTLGRIEQAREAVEQWVREVPGDPAPFREYARQLIQDGQIRAADSVLQRAQAALGSGRGLELELAQLRSSMGLWALSAESWRGALAAAPYLEQAAVFALVPTAPAARAEVRRTLLARPVSVPARRVVAALELAWGSPRDGWLALRDLRPDTAVLAAWLDFARRAEENEMWLAARDALVAVLVHRTSPDIAIRAARAALNGNDPRSGLALAEYAAADMTPNLAAASTLPLTLEALSLLGRPDIAQRALDAQAQYLTRQQLSRFKRMVAWGWIRGGEIARARALIAETSGDAAEDDSDAAGWLALYEGDLRAARLSLRTRGQPSPELVTALALLARTSADSSPSAGRAFLALARRDTLLAAASFEEAARSLTDAGTLLLAAAARLHASRGDDEKAITLWKVLALSHTEAPEAPEANLEWARSLRRNGRNVAAIERLEHLILTYPNSALVPQARRELELARGAVPSTS